MRLFALIGILCIVLSAGCTKRTIKIDRSMRRVIDTTAAPRIVILREELDSLCTMRQDSMVAAAVDSIMQVRRGEVSKISKKRNREND